MSLGIGLQRIGIGGGSVSLGTLFHVNSTGGSDSNNGLSPATAFLTVGKAATEADAEDGRDRIALASDGYWRQTLAPQEDFRSISRYGSGGVPVLDGAEVIAPGDFTLSAHADAAGVVYEVSLVGDANGDVGNNDSIMIWQDNVWLQRQTSVAATAATAGSFYLPSPYISNSNPLTPRTAYVHPFDSTNPTSDGNTYEYSKRNLLIQLADRVGAIVEGVHVKRGASDYGSIASSGTSSRPVLRRVLSSYGGKHNMVHRDGTLEDVICFDAEIGRLALADGGLIPITFYSPDATGLMWNVRRSMVIFPDGRNTTGIGPIYSHSGSALTVHTLGQVDAFITRNCGALAAEIKNLELNDFCMLNVLGVAFNLNGTQESITIRRAFLQDKRATVNSSTVEKNATYAADLTFSGGCIMSDVGTGGSPASFYQLDVTSADNTAVENNTFYRKGPLGGNVRISAAAAGSTFRNNIVVVNQSGGSRYVDLPTGMSVDYNVYINLDGATGKFWAQGATTRNALATWRSLTGYDTNSVLLDSTQAAQLFLGDPRDGDFRINPACALTFVDGTPLVGNAGPQEYYDWNVGAVQGGQHTQWPEPPYNEAECEEYIGDPASWDFYPALGPNLVTNGGFATDTGWTKGAGWTITNGRLYANTGAFSGTTQAGSYTANTTYEVTLDVVVTSGFMVVYLGNGTSVQVTATQMGRKISVTSGATASPLTIAGFNFVGWVDNVYVREVL